MNFANHHQNLVSYMLRKKLCTILIVIIGITAWVLPVNAAQLAQLP
ncbi:MAG: hypothetical protein RLZZ381_1296, partial [Cyanobacteriota bacterium]